MWTICAKTLAVVNKDKNAIHFIPVVSYNDRNHHLYSDIHKCIVFYALIAHGYMCDTCEMELPMEMLLEVFEHVKILVDKLYFVVNVRKH